MLSTIGRFFAVLIGLVFVAGGGVCTAIDATFFFTQLARGNSVALLALVGIALSVGTLWLGLFMMGVIRRSRPGEAALAEATGSGAYIGKRFFITVLTLAPNGEVLERQQLHGVGLHIDGTAVVVELQGSAHGTTLAVRIWSIVPAPANGTYIVESTGEEVRDPDFIVEIRRPTNSSSDVAA